MPPKVQTIRKLIGGENPSCLTAQKETPYLYRLEVGVDNNEFYFEFLQCGRVYMIIRHQGYFSKTLVACSVWVRSIQFIDSCFPVINKYLINCPHKEKESVWRTPEYWKSIQLVNLLSYLFPMVPDLMTLQISAQRTKKTVIARLVPKHS